MKMQYSTIKRANDVSRYVVRFFFPRKNRTIIFGDRTFDSVDIPDHCLQIVFFKNSINPDDKKDISVSNISVKLLFHCGSYLFEFDSWGELSCGGWLDIDYSQLTTKNKLIEKAKEIADLFWQTSFSGLLTHRLYLDRVISLKYNKIVNKPILKPETILKQPLSIQMQIASKYSMYKLFKSIVIKNDTDINQIKTSVSQTPSTKIIEFLLKNKYIGIQNVIISLLQRQRYYCEIDWYKFMIKIIKKYEVPTLTTPLIDLINVNSYKDDITLELFNLIASDKDNLLNSGNILVKLNDPRIQQVVNQSIINCAYVRSMANHATRSNNIDALKMLEKHFNKTQDSRDYITNILSAYLTDLVNVEELEYAVHNQANDIIEYLANYIIFNTLGRLSYVGIYLNDSYLFKILFVRLIKSQRLNDNDLSELIRRIAVDSFNRSYDNQLIFIIGTVIEYRNDIANETFNHSGFNDNLRIYIKEFLASKNSNQSIPMESLE